MKKFYLFLLAAFISIAANAQNKNLKTTSEAIYFAAEDLNELSEYEEVYDLFTMKIEKLSATELKNKTLIIWTNSCGDYIIERFDGKYVFFSGNTDLRKKLKQIPLRYEIYKDVLCIFSNPQKGKVWVLVGVHKRLNPVTE